MRGGLQIVLDGKTVGAVGVSGVQADQDEAVAHAAVDAISELWKTHGQDFGSRSIHVRSKL